MTVIVYLSGHLRRLTDEPSSHWRQIFIGYFEGYAAKHYKAKKVYPLPQVRFVSPLERSDALEVNATRDKYLMNMSHFAVCYINLHLGKGLGGAFEIGYLKAHHKPIILINESRDVAGTRFLEHNADIVCHDLDTGALALYSMIKDVTEGEEL
jgi:nucleoside 2-deoxyribosyltransferase